MTDSDIFKSEWNFARKLTLELLDSLTDTELSKPPGRDLGPFWKQFRHVGRLQECYVEALTTKAISFDYANKRFKGGCSKDALKTYLQELERQSLQVIEQVDWKIAINWDGEKVGVLQHLMRMASHEILHHGQCPAFGNKAASQLESMGSVRGRLLRTRELFICLQHRSLITRLRGNGAFESP